MTDIAIANDTPLYDTTQRSGPLFALRQRDDKRLTLQSDQGHVVHLFVLTEWLLRVTLLPDGIQRTTRTWAIAPGKEDVPFEGVDKSDLSAFDPVPYSAVTRDDLLTVETACVRLIVELHGFVCRWQLRVDNDWIEVARDRPTQAYNFGQWGRSVCHYLVRSATERYFGLGEKSGDANRAGQSYRMRNVDGAFYSARTSDPLYKHIPFYITHDSRHGAAFGLFYDTHSDCTFDMGREIGNYHGPYRYFMAEAGDLDYYFIAGPQIRQVVTRFTWLTGLPAFPPRWTLGYSGSTMSYTDAPDAQARMAEFISQCRAHDIPCQSFHLSSGYTSIGNKRYVFHWNTSKFADARRFIAEYKAAGVRVIANIKPALLTDHPRYEEARAQGLFVTNADHHALTVPFWGGQASYVDFTRPAAVRWWQQCVREHLLDYGVAGTWNDNNEFEIAEVAARAFGHGQPVPASEIKPLLTMLMLKASVGAQRDSAPQIRPFAVSRAGVTGMQRYVQTWSGDNYTSWETLKYNIRMGLGLAMSGVSNTGHDVGGFLGPAPDQELFVRWVQFGIFMPRFSIHSENSDGTVTEPWMYPAWTPTVRALLALRHRFQPYFYDLLWHAHTECAPIVRPTYYDFSHDDTCFEENDDMMIGPHLLHAAVAAPGVRARSVYLPAGTDWFDYFSGTRYEGGRWHAMPASLQQPLLFARAGAIIPVNRADAHFGDTEDRRGFVIFPPRNGRATGSAFEDDGESIAWRRGHCGHWQIAVDALDDRLQVSVAFDGSASFRQDTLTIELPAQECRPISVQGYAVTADVQAEGRRLLHLAWRDSFGQA
ncbi:TIM-barrel domain-containing protein [Uliginosibacterium sp. sgz301328]|uniref:glycoside hydrolase family 31 protein n=1 Tax=Uliginosibacterium sp. sgz301328 TaxID=3243764 RepID=UPI00359CBE94